MSQVPPNPYQSNVAGAPLPPAGSAKPTSITVFGILNIIFGALGICGLSVAVVGLFAPMAAGMELPEDNPMNSPAYRVFTIVTIPLGLVATIVLVAAGVGLLNDKDWGRKFSIGYAIYAIVSGLIGTVLNVVLIMVPMMQQMGGGEQMAAAVGGMVGGTIGGCIGLIYPALLWYFMTRPHVVNYLRAHSPEF